MDGVHSLLKGFVGLLESFGFCLGLFAAFVLVVAIVGVVFQRAGYRLFRKNSRKWHGFFSGVFALCVVGMFAIGALDIHRMASLPKQPDSLHQHPANNHGDIRYYTTAQWLLSPSCAWLPLVVSGFLSFLLAGWARQAGDPNYRPSLRAFLARPSWLKKKDAGQKKG